MRKYLAIFLAAPLVCAVMMLVWNNYYLGYYKLPFYNEQSLTWTIILVGCYAVCGAMFFCAAFAAFKMENKWRYRSSAMMTVLMLIFSLTGGDLSLPLGIPWCLHTNVFLTRMFLAFFGFYGGIWIVSIVKR